MIPVNCLSDRLCNPTDGNSFSQPTSQSAQYSPSGYNMKMAQTTTVQETEDTNSAAFIEFLTGTPGQRGSQGEEMGVRGETGSYSWIISITNDHHPFCFLCYAKTIFAMSMRALKYVFIKETRLESQGQGLLSFSLSP